MTLISRRAIFQGLVAGLLSPRHVLAQSRVLSKPRPLAPDAVTHDWTAFLGPTHNAVSTETRLTRRLLPPLIWEFTRGSGYASPAIAGTRLRGQSGQILRHLHAPNVLEHLHHRGHDPSQTL